MSAGIDLNICVWRGHIGTGNHKVQGLYAEIVPQKADLPLHGAKARKTMDLRGSSLIILGDIGRGFIRSRLIK